MVRKTFTAITMRTFGWTIVASVLMGLVWTQPKNRDVSWGWNEERWDVQRFQTVSDNDTPVQSDPSPIQSLSGDVGHRIINGEVSEYGRHPYICSLQVQFQGKWYFICGAVIYNNRTILTAAHCVDQFLDSKFRVRCGEFQLNRADYYEVTRTVVKIKMHPKWKNNATLGFPNDLALLKVRPRLSFNNYVNALPIADRKANIPKDCQLLGWGVTETGRISMVLREVTVRRLSRRKCRETWGRLIKGGHICFMDEGQPDSSCNGDSGGPAVCGGYLVGVTSWGVKDCLEGYPSVYTYLPRYKRWIRRWAFS